MRAIYVVKFYQSIVLKICLTACCIRMSVLGERLLASFHHYSHHIHLAVFFSHLILFIRTKLNCKVTTVYIGYVELDRAIPSRSTPELFNMVQFDTSSLT